MDSIKAILPEVLKHLKRKQGYAQEDIENLWVRCVRKNVAQHTRAKNLKDRKLFVLVENPAWLYELRINKEQILKKLSKQSRNKIKDVNFRVGDINGSRQ